MTEKNFGEEIVKRLPMLIKNENFRAALEKDQGKGSFQAIFAWCAVPQTVTQPEDEDFSWAIRDIFINQAEFNLTLGWEGGSAGNSGAVYLCGYKNRPFIIWSGDYDDMGPFDSLEDALQEGCFNCETPNAALDSEDLLIEKLIEIARNLVSHDEEGETWINGDKYVVSGDALVCSKSNLN